MKYIKFTMSRGKDFTLPEKQATALLLGEKQIAPIPEEDGYFHGRTINMAHIVSTDFDIERELDEDRKARAMIVKLPEGKNEKVNLKKIAELRNMLKKKMIIKK